MNPSKIGDVPDFGKYTLLNTLRCPQPSKNGPHLTLGVVWYVTTPPNDSESTVAKVGSDHQSRLAACNPALWNQLQRIPKKDVGEIERSGILGSGTKYHPALVPDDLSIRASSWQPAALSATKGRDLVFLDPDTGVWQWDDDRKKRREDPRQYVRPNEIPPYLQRNQSVVIYQHLHWSKKDDEELLKKWSSIQKQLPGRSGFAVRYDVAGVRVCFIVIPSERHRVVLQGRARSLVENNCWRQYFSWVDLR